MFLLWLFFFLFLQALKQRFLQDFQLLQGDSQQPGDVADQHPCSSIIVPLNRGKPRKAISWHRGRLNSEQCTELCCRTLSHTSKTPSLRPSSSSVCLKTIPLSRGESDKWKILNPCKPYPVNRVTTPGNCGWKKIINPLLFILSDGSG